jgi:hypothetical protein
VLRLKKTTRKTPTTTTGIQINRGFILQPIRAADERQEAHHDSAAVLFRNAASEKLAST